MKFGTQLTE